MDLYLLTRPITGYDQAIGFVVCADNAVFARQIASEQCGDEGPAPWLDTDKSSCCTIGTNDNIIGEGVILRSFRHG